MDSEDGVAARGGWGSVVWATDARARRPAKEFYDELSEKDKAKVNALFGRLAEQGAITNREKFKKLEADLFEFKSHQIRLLGNFRPGRQFVVAHGVRKKKNDLDPQDLEAAARILGEHDNQGGRKK